MDFIHFHFLVSRLIGCGQESLLMKYWSTMHWLSTEIGESTGKNDPKHFAETTVKENAAFYTMSRLRIG
jgi:hypothetical protein